MVKYSFFFYFFFFFFFFLHLNVIIRKNKYINKSIRSTGYWMSVSRLLSEDFTSPLIAGWENDAIARDRSVADENGRDAFESGTSQF